VIVCFGAFIAAIGGDENQEDVDEEEEEAMTCSNKVAEVAIKGNKSIESAANGQSACNDERGVSSL